MEPRRDRSLGAALGAIEARFFVGRESECRMFADCLARRLAEWRILNVYGPGGVGKSTLLDAFARLAAAAGSLWVRVDAADLPRTPRRVAERIAALAAAASGGRPPSDRDPPGGPASGRNALADCLAILGRAAARGPVTLAFDSYEQIGAADRWLRAAFLPRLPEGVFVVVAGRLPLQGVWHESPGWRQLIQPLGLRPFDLTATRRYLGLHGVSDVALTRAAWEFTRGHPLALSLTTALVRREGTAALGRVASRPELVAELSRRWLREVPDPGLRVLVEAAAVVRHFDQDLLAHVTGVPVATADFARLTALSFVRAGPSGWSLLDLVRSALVQELGWRSPAGLRRLKRRALDYFARLLAADAPAGGPVRDVPARAGTDWGTALEAFFYLLGDALIGAAFFALDGEDPGEVYVTPAGPADLPELAAYGAEGRARAEAGGPTEFELLDPESGTRFRYQYLWVDFVRVPLDFDGLLALGVDAVRVARDAAGRLRGVSVVIPVHAGTLPYLERQPVSGPYFRRLTPDERAGYATASDRTSAWYLRHLHVREPRDAAARGALLRDLFRVTLREGRLLTSSPAPFFQDLLRRSGFVEVPGAAHHDFGPDLPSPTYVLDVRGPRLAGYLARLLGEEPAARPGDAGFAAQDLPRLLAARLSAWTGEDRPGAAAPAAGGQAPAGEPGVLEALTRRERQVALAVLDGLSNDELADRLGMAPLTAKKHLTHIFAKVGVASRTQLIRRLLAAARP